jgi:hypothetical protein
MKKIDGRFASRNSYEPQLTALIPRGMRFRGIR